VARDELPNRHFLYAQFTAISVPNLSAVAIFFQKRNIVFLHCPFSTKKKRSKIIFYFFLEKMEGKRHLVLKEYGILFLKENRPAQFIN